VKNDLKDDPPLPATAVFVTFLAFFLIVCWMGMYLLLRSRWVY
jgi:hypothetical protein